MKVLFLAATLLTLSSQVFAAPTHFIACRGKMHRVIMEQWDYTLQLKSRNGQYRSLHLIIPPAAQQQADRVAFKVAEEHADYSVVRYVTGKPDQLAARPVVPTAVDIMDRSGKEIYEANIPCVSEPYQGRDR